jgi:D-3-phosphoglycerate dehydrogenase
MKRFNLLVTSPSFASCSEGLLEELESLGAGVTHIKRKEKLREDELVEIIGDAEGIIVGTDIMGKRVIDKAHNLKVISKHGVGLDNIDLAAAKEKSIEVAYAAGSNTIAVAELACSMILALSRGIVQSTGEVAAGKWERRKGMELAGSALGVVGVGAIGKQVIKRMSAFDMRIFASDPYPDDEFALAYGAQYAPIDKVVAISDFLTLHLPLTTETTGLIGEERLKKMKPDSFLVNTARGGIVDEQALYDALRAGRLAGAGIDTFVDEPPTGNPLLQLPNVVATPHLGAYTRQAIDKMSRAAAANIMVYMKKNGFGRVGN